MGDEDLFNCDYDELKSETDLAWLFDIDGMDVWLPKSRCILHEDEGYIEIPEWLGIEKGLL